MSAFDLTSLNEKNIIQIPLNQIVDNEANIPDLNKYEHQMKIEALASSIVQEGLNNPIIVVINDDGDYRIVQGHSRVAAFRLLNKQYGGYDQVDAYIYDFDNRAKEIRSLHRDNALKKDYSKVEICQIVEQYLHEVVEPYLRKQDIYKGIATKTIIAKELGMSDTTVQQYLTIIKADKIILDAFYKEIINVTGCYTLATAQLTSKQVQDIVKEAENQQKNGNPLQNKDIKKMISQIKTPITKDEYTIVHTDHEFELCGIPAFEKSKDQNYIVTFKNPISAVTLNLDVRLLRLDVSYNSKSLKEIYVQSIMFKQEMNVFNTFLKLLLYLNNIMMQHKFVKISLSEICDKFENLLGGKENG